MTAPAETTPASLRPPRGALGAALRSPGVIVGGLVLLVLAGAALWSFTLDPFEVTRRTVRAFHWLPPSAEHWLGTDHQGRDIFMMLVLGARVALGVAAGAVLIGVAFGVPLGLFAAARGGVPGETAMRFADLVFAFPALVTALILAAVYGPSATGAAVAIGVFNIPVFARITRAGALAVLSRDFILAARVAGKGRLRIVAEHVLPNVAGLVIVQASLQFGIAVLAEAALSFVGYGVAPPMPSWGGMLAASQLDLVFAPHTVLAPGLVIVAAVLAAGFLGDGLRDALDPRVRARRG